MVEIFRMAGMRPAPTVSEPNRTAPPPARDHRGIPAILTVGCGGAGSHGITHLSARAPSGTATAAVNTDWPDLLNTQADKRVLIGKRITRGLGTGGDPELARRAGDSSLTTLMELVEGVNLLFITAGLGGGTGTGVAPQLARMARENGTLVVALVTLPFDLERERLKRARSGLEELKAHADCVIALDNNRLVREAGDRPLAEAFGYIDDFIAKVIQSVTETITRSSVINLDFADVRKVLSYRGLGTILHGRTDSYDPDILLGELMNNPLYDINVKGARGALIHITAGVGLTLAHMEDLISGVRGQLAEDAHVVTGVRIDPAMGRSAQALAMVTGIEGPAPEGTNARAELAGGDEDVGEADEGAPSGLESLSRGNEGGAGGGDWSRWDIRMVA